ncbi:Hsp70 family protein [Nucisporomicrobium flavum]|uniref:Hsp70 family protein n=1 Tax=Nucisporomicrobium flavum TaxID=2785915 RepID=UPI003C2CBDC0
MHHRVLPPSARVRIASSARHRALLSSDGSAIFWFIGGVHPSLAIDYGAAATRAVLIQADGSWLVLQGDGSWQWSSAVHVAGGEVTVGAQAWQRATTDPDGFVVSPLRAGTGEVTVHGVEVPVADLAAASLRQAAAEAARVVGEPVSDVRMVVPAGWGPRRRTWLRHAARSAGLIVTGIVEAPVAAASRIAPAPDLGSGRVLLIIDVGAGCEATIVQHTAAGYEVLATIADTQAGGDRIDDRLAAAVTGTELEDLPGGQRWLMLATVRATRQALSEQVAVTMPLPDGQPPMVVNAVQVAQAAQPVLERAAELAAEAVAAADLTLADVHGVHLIGGLAAMPDAAGMIGAKLGVAPQPAAQPALAAAAGAAESSPATVAARAGGAGTTSEPLRLPPLRRLLWLGLPGAASLALFWHFVLAADIFGSQPLSRYRGGIYELYASWPKLTMAVVLAQVCLLQFASVFAALLDHSNPPQPGQPGRGSRITAGIGIAAAGGPAIGFLYAVTAGAYFNVPTYSLTIQYAVWPILPIAALAAVLALFTWRRRSVPTDGWDGFLAFPGLSLTAATLGIVLVSLPMVEGMPAWLNGWGPALGYAGGLLTAIGAAFALTRHLAVRAILSLIFAIPLMVFAQTYTGYKTLGTIYAITVAAWLIIRLYALLTRQRPPASG